MRKLTLLLLFALPSERIHAQITFQKTYGGTATESISGLFLTADSGYVMSGTTDSFGDDQFYMVKTDQYGDTVWTKTYRFYTYNWSRCLTQTSDGGYLVTGQTATPSGSWQPCLMKTDSLGNLQWAKKIISVGSATLWSVLQSQDGGYVATTGNFRILKLDSLGNVTSSCQYSGGSATNNHTFIMQTPDGGLLLSGNMEISPFSNTDIYLIKTDSSGNAVWAKTYGGASNDYCWGAVPASDGGFLVLTHSFIYTPGAPSALVLRIDSAGNLLWSKIFGNTTLTHSDFYAAKEMSDGGFVLAGSALGGYIIRIDAAGDTVWTREVNGNASFTYIHRAFDGGFIFGGGHGNNGGDFFLVKTDSLGHSGCLTAATSTLDTVVYPTVINQFPAVTPLGMTSSLLFSVTGSGGSVTTFCFNNPTLLDETKNRSNTVFIFPNPISGSGAVTFTLSKSEKVSLKIFDLNGRLISALAEGMFDAGENKVSWDAGSIEAGIYLLRMEASGRIQTQIAAIIE